MLDKYTLLNFLSLHIIKDCGLSVFCFVHWQQGICYMRGYFNGNALDWDQIYWYGICDCPIYKGRYIRELNLELLLDGTSEI